MLIWHMIPSYWALTVMVNFAADVTELGGELHTETRLIWAENKEGDICVFHRYGISHDSLLSTVAQNCKPYQITQQASHWRDPQCQKHQIYRDEWFMENCLHGARTASCEDALIQVQRPLVLQRPRHRLTCRAQKEPSPLKCFPQMKDPWCPDASLGWQ